MKYHFFPPTILIKFLKEKVYSLVRDSLALTARLSRSLWEASVALIRLERPSPTLIAQRIGRGSVILASFMTVQVIVQALGVFAGFVIVRALDKSDYAFYAVTNSVTATFALLCNGGIVDAATAIGGRAWQDPHRMGQILASARKLRGWLAKWITVPTALVLAWMLLQNGAGATDILILLVLGWLAAYYQISSEILRVALRLQGRIPQLQKLDLAGAVLRAMLCLAVFVLASAETAILTAAVTTAAVFFLTRGAMARTTDLAAIADPEVESEIWLVVKRQWPSALAYVFQGQIVFLLLSFLGKAEAVADYGALGRIAAIFGIFGAVLSAIVLPRYARCQDARRLRALYILVLLSYTVVALLPAAAALAFPTPLLWILGPQYANLEHELFLVTLNAGMMSIGFLAWGLNSVRAWVIPPWINITIMYGTQVLLMAAIGFNTMDKVLWIGIFWSLGSIASSVVATFVFSKNFARV